MNNNCVSFLDDFNSRSHEDYLDLFKVYSGNNPFAINQSVNNIDSCKETGNGFVFLEKSSPLLPIFSNNKYSSYFENKFLTSEINSSDNELLYNDININDSFDVKVNNNQEIIKQLNIQNERFENKILDIIKSEIYESGKISKIERFMYDECNDNNLIFIKQVALKILYDNLDNSHIIEGILRLFSTKSYDEMAPEGPICCLSLLSNKSLLVKNKAIEIFEKWNSKKCVKQLEGQKCFPAWVQKHLLNVINYLKNYGN